MVICGRPTNRGAPCARVLLWYETACGYHATPDELEQATQRLRNALHTQLADEGCDCPCHANVQPGLVTCPRCSP